jgi:hypothetical protein
LQLSEPVVNDPKNCLHRQSRLLRDAAGTYLGGNSQLKPRSRKN